MYDFVFTSSGRLFDMGPMATGESLREFSDGKWGLAKSDVIGEDLMDGFSLSKEEADAFCRSGKIPAWISAHIDRER